MNEFLTPKFPDPIADKFSRTIAGHYVQFKQKRMNCVVHAIYDERAKFLYTPVQKVACSSMKTSLVEYFFETRGQGEMDPKHKFPHKYFWGQPQFWITIDALRKFDFFKFCIVRDPVDRFISGYKNRIFDYKDLVMGRTQKINRKHLPEFPDINFFAMKLNEYCKANRRLDWHFRPQTKVLGDASVYDCVYDISEIDKLYADLKNRCGVVLTPHKQNVSRSHTSTELNIEAREAVRDFYHADYMAFADIINRQS